MAGFGTLSRRASPPSPRAFSSAAWLPVGCPRPAGSPDLRAGQRRGQSASQTDTNPSRTATLSDTASQPSKQLLEESFVAEDERFLDVLRQCNSYPYLLGFVERWVSDPRPWARTQIVKFIQADLSTPGHEVVFKRLLKHFEAATDHDMLAHFLVALDRLVRRIRINAPSYDPGLNQWTPREVLFAQPNRSAGELPGPTAADQRTALRHHANAAVPRNRPGNRLFSQRTRAYLRRRIWRYFRGLSHRTPTAYVAAISGAMCEFRDADFVAGENILDNWSLMHACYFHHPAMTFTASHCNLVAGHSLGELTPAPYQPRAWRSEKGASSLLHLITEAKSSLVRMWAIDLLRQEHRPWLSQLDVQTLISMLKQVDPRVQEFAAELLQEHADAGSLGIATWLELLDQPNQAALTLVCAAMQKHVSPNRMESGQIVALACARPVPVAQLGLEMLRQRQAERPLLRETLAQLAQATCQSVAGELTAWVLRQIGTPAQYDVDCVTEFFDSMLSPTRAAALDWLVEPQSPGYHDPVLWSRLVETPFDDVRFRLIDCLQRREALSGQTTGDLSHVWVAVILGVHRGGRSKRKAIQQVATAIEGDLTLADRLLPVLAVAMRSVRAPERRAAMSALVTLMVRHMELRERVFKLLPELRWPAAQGAAP